MLRRRRTVQHSAWGAVVAILVGCAGGSETAEPTALEQEAVAADQQFLDTYLAVRAQLPNTRDAAPLLAMFVDDEQASAVRDPLEETWADAYEVDGRMDVVRQETTVIDEATVEVRTCARDWINIVAVDGSRTDFRGEVGFPNGWRLTWVLRDGTWLIASVGYDRPICTDIARAYEQ